MEGEEGMIQLGRRGWDGVVWGAEKGTRLLGEERERRDSNKKME